MLFLRHKWTQSLRSSKLQRFISCLCCIFIFGSSASSPLNSRTQDGRTVTVQTAASDRGTGKEDNALHTLCAAYPNFHPHARPFSNFTDQANYMTHTNPPLEARVMNSARFPGQNWKILSKWWLPHWFHVIMAKCTSALKHTNNITSGYIIQKKFYWN